MWLAEKLGQRLMLSGHYISHCGLPTGGIYMSEEPTTAHHHSTFVPKWQFCDPSFTLGKLVELAYLHQTLPNGVALKQAGFKTIVAVCRM